MTIMNNQLFRAYFYKKEKPANILSAGIRFEVFG